MSSFHIRQAKVDDAAGIAKVHVGTWQYAYRGQIPDSYLQSLDVANRTERWKDILSHPEGSSHTIVAVADDTVLGFCSIGHCRDKDMSANVGELWAIYVDPKSMGKGIGSELMEKGLDYLRVQGYTKATLWVLSSNERTRKWYEAKGWREEGKTKTEHSRGFDLHETRYIIAL